jgi:hypothetical protein
MTIVRRPVRYGLALLVCLLLAGCQNMPRFSELPMPEVPDVRKFRLLSFSELRHELRPHRLHRWNRHTPPNRSDDW